MRASLDILAQELRRLKAAGVKAVAVSPESLDALKKAVAGMPRPEPVAGGEDSPVARGRAPLPSEAKGDAGQGRGERPARPGAPAEAIVPIAEPPRPAPKAPAPAKPAASALPPAPVVKLPDGPKQARWDALRAQVMADPTCRANVRAGKQVVLGVGSLDAKIMFVGEAPGAEEEVKGEPFVGPAGKLLDRMISGMGVKRSDVYIGNIMNWRPQMPVGADGVQYGNRPPTEAEMAYCLPYLRAQIAIVEPDVLVALGNTAAQGLLGFGTFRALGEVRGRWKDFAGKPLMVTYHPSYILRNQTNQAKRMVWEDLLKVMERAGLPISEKQRGYFLEP